jgi:competence protein ComEA
MARPPRIFWLASLAVIVYLLWRWQKRREIETLLPPTSPSPPEPSPAPAIRADASSTPRRIPTRVHRGAPPSLSDRTKQVVEQAQDALVGMAEQVQEVAADVGEQVRDVIDQAVAAGAEKLEQAEAALDTAVDQAKNQAQEVADHAQEAAAEATGQVADIAEQAEQTTAEAIETAREVATTVGSSRAVGEAVEDAQALVDPGLGAADASPTEPVNVNTAALETLVALPGIGAVLAERIVRYRTENGPFNSIDELTEVSGIGARNLATFRHFITV